jgi:hypothetical protein
VPVVPLPHEANKRERANSVVRMILVSENTRGRGGYNMTYVICHFNCSFASYFVRCVEALPRTFGTLVKLHALAFATQMASPLRGAWGILSGFVVSLSITQKCFLLEKELTHRIMPTA